MIQWQPRYKELLINTNELHIWRSILPPTLNQLNSYWQILASDEKTRANQFRFERDKIRYIVGRGILRELIARYIKNSPKTIKLDYTQHGKPFLVTSSSSNELYFNLSHSHDCIVCAFTKNIDVGIDVELYQPQFTIEDVAKYCFSKQEYDKLQNLSSYQKHSYFYSVWTLKEAFVKSIGLGLTYDLQQIKIDLLPQESACSVSILNSQEEGTDWTFQTFCPYKNYYAAFATRQILKRILYFNFD